MSILLLSAAFALNSAQPNYILSEPEWRGNDRSVLVECTPYPYGRSRVVTRDVPAAPDFLVAGHQILTRTPAGNAWCSTPGPAWYGAPADTFIRTHAWVGEVAISFDPFSRLATGTPGQLRRAQNLWLNEAGMVNQARLVRRAHPAPRVEEESANRAAPEPIMVIPKPQKKNTRELPLEVHRLSPTRIMITDGSITPDVNTTLAAK